MIFAMHGLCLEQKIIEWQCEQTFDLLASPVLGGSSFASGFWCGRHIGELNRIKA